ncbi:MAG TPA: SgcJ/EcaC family oxidoreductase [Vicinamibacterales bacterium]|nr:SgcJ/EcaC family oxidoreductase [Vicinamibacterales bacterium]
MSTHRSDFIGVPTNRVVGTVSDAGNAKGAIDALLAAGFEPQEIDILHGEEDLHRLDLTGAEHGFLAQFHRTVIRSFELDEFKHLTAHVEDVRAGRYVIMVLTKRRSQRAVAADILHHYGASFVGFYGRWAWEDLPPTGQTTPADVPVLFAHAWNAHDPDALASLFDEDAEFVNGAGLCWHNRESIRKAHATRMERVNGGTLAADEAKVKLLSPEVAVVHARMTLSSEAQTMPRTTIASFVVHRAGDRWLCASAHNTDVMPDQEMTGVESGGSARG